MNTESKYLLKVLFKLKIYESDATAFEDLFTCVMVQAHPEFKRVKPYGNLGDRKNDGYVRHIGRYYQCYGPEDLTKKETIKRGVTKLSDDFKGLVSYWDGAYEVKEFFYVVNDKYKGLPPDITLEIDEMNLAYDTVNIDSLCSDQLETIFIELPEDKYSNVIGFYPSINDIEIDFDALFEVVEFLENHPIMPDPFSPLESATLFDEKIQINGLTGQWADCLRYANYQNGALEDFFSQSGKSGLKRDLQTHYTNLYKDSKKSIGSDVPGAPALRLAYIITHAMPKNTASCFHAALAIAALFFESCDIFEKTATQE